MKHTIILRHQGVDCTYHCNTAWEAATLFEALRATGSRVEMWNGATLVQQFN